MKSAGMLFTGLFLVLSMTGCYHCSYKYNPCTGITEQQCKKIGFGCKKSPEPGCGTCETVVAPECGYPEVSCSCEAPVSCGCEVPEVSCALPQTCAIPTETCGCAMPHNCACGYPMETVAPSYSPQPTPEPKAVEPPAAPSATQTHYTVPHQHFH